jgi:phosphatidylglycerophosphate synthase
VGVEPLPLPLPIKERSQLETWSRAHAPLMLVAAACSLARGALWPVALAAMGSFSVMIVRARDGWAINARTIAPNAVTALRLSIILAAGISMHGALGIGWAAAVAVVFALDYIDGWLARRANGTSEFGARFDMETDALVVLVVDLELYLRGEFGPWILLTGFLRYAYVVCVALVPPRSGEVPRSKFGWRAFGTLVIGLSLALALPGPVGTVGAAIGTAAVTLSFARSFHWSYF